jgi:hypothetical protein
VEAQKGNATAARSLILPVYQPLIYSLLVRHAAASCLLSSLRLTLAVLVQVGLFLETIFVALYQGGVWAADNILSWAVYEWIRDGFGMLFLQNNVSRAAFKRAAYLSLIW